MLLASAGPLSGFVALFALPLIGALILPPSQFAMWSILNSVGTVALSLDFGGVALVMSRLDSSRRAPLLLRAAALSSGGAAIVGLIACLAWLFYSRTEAGQVFTLGEGIAAILLMSVGAIMRSAVAVLGQAALNDGLFGLRTFSIGGQAFILAPVALVLAAAWQSAWALPVGWAISSAVVLVVASVWGAARSLFSRLPTIAAVERSRTSTFVVARTAATIAGAVLLQGDRWVVGAIGGSGLLAVYEVAWRVATLPRYLMQVLSSIVGSQVPVARAGANPWPRVRLLLRRALVVVGLAGAISCIVVVAIYPPIATFVGADDGTSFMFLMAIAFTLNGLTAPITVGAIGAEIPTIDLPYTAAMLLGYASAAVAASLLGQPLVFIFGSCASIALASVALLFGGWASIRRRLATQGLEAA